jgi:hypothetical protein
MELRPHIATWSVPGTGPTEDPATGFPIENLGVTKTAKCRFHPENKRQFVNQANENVIQKGRIRFDVGSEMPDVYTHVVVTDGDRVIFAGPVLEPYRGQLGYRCDV